MTEEALKFINSFMETLGLTYAFMEYVPDGKPSYPYFVGEYQEEEPLTEDGEQDTVFVLTGYSRTKHAELEEAKIKIKKYLGIEGKTVITDIGSAVAVFYMNAFTVPTGDAELKKIQINLKIKEWGSN